MGGLWQSSVYGEKLFAQESLFSPGGAMDLHAYKSGLQQMKSGETVAHQRFNPYSDEGGSIAAIAGDNFVVIAADTRLARDGYTLLTRNHQRIFKLSSTVFLGCASFLGDINQLVKVLDTRARIYNYNFHEEMSVEAVSELLSRTLYYKRFFPYYVNNLLVGIDKNGKGAIYGYDPVGCLERLPFVSCGASEQLLDPVLDSLIGNSNKTTEAPKLTLERAMAILRDAFRSASEREATTGDKVHFVTLVAGKEPVEEDVLLRAD